MTELLGEYSAGAMSVDQFAKWAGIGRTMVYEQIRTGELAAIKASRRITFEAASRWLKTRPVLPARENSRANY